MAFLLRTALHPYSARSTAATHRVATAVFLVQATQTVGLKQLELIHVKKCAKEITGSDKPRKLPPAQARAVNACAQKFMPPTHTKTLLQAEAKKILYASCLLPLIPARKCCAYFMNKGVAIPPL